ncbi:hypothetical protein BLNAU_8486 [Blattamonas nauphoetae]|uniref:Uncharacterized protein n=1 Tax=Blattamonas nauphoetae TaxID=2049346 RepID=A0ABQ9XYS0_9EUKA|nr:hypothetical protein BLNAU_8486 [Blattamonas nauphoetae]
MSPSHNTKPTRLADVSAESEAQHTTLPQPAGERVVSCETPFLVAFRIISSRPSVWNGCDSDEKRGDTVRERENWYDGVCEL